LLQAPRVCIERAEHGLACLLDLVLRLSGFQCRREIAPEPIQARVRHFEYAADILRALLDQEPGGCRRIAVFTGFAAAVPLQQSERDKGVEKIIGSARMQAHGALQFKARLGAVRKPREQLQLYGAQQRLGRPEPKADLQDVVWRNFAWHLNLPEIAECTRGSPRR